MLQQVAAHIGASPDECFFWATHSGAELDLLVVRGRRRWAFEFKRSSAPTFTKSLRAAIDALQPARTFVIHAGDRSFHLREHVTAIAAGRLLEDLPVL